MIQEFVDIYDTYKYELQQALSEAHPASYKELVTMVINFLASHMDEYTAPRGSRIAEIDHGDYQGTLIYVIGASGYQPHDYWYVKVGYGSCSGCDTLQDIQSNGEYNSPPTPQQTDDYMILALHLIQGLKKMD